MTLELCGELKIMPDNRSYLELLEQELFLYDELQCGVPGVTKSKEQYFSEFICAGRLCVAGGLFDFDKKLASELRVAPELVASWTEARFVPPEQTRKLVIDTMWKMVCKIIDERSKPKEPS